MEPCPRAAQLAPAPPRFWPALRTTSSTPLRVTSDKRRHSLSVRQTRRTRVNEPVIFSVRQIFFSFLAASGLASPLSGAAASAPPAVTSRAAAPMPRILIMPPHPKLLNLRAHGSRMPLQRIDSRQDGKLVNVANCRYYSRGGFSSALSAPRRVRTSRWFQPGLVSIERSERLVAAARAGGRK